jgi:hypothetical protein
MELITVSFIGAAAVFLAHLTVLLGHRLFGLK